MWPNIKRAVCVEQNFTNKNYSHFIFKNNTCSCMYL